MSTRSVIARRRGDEWAGVYVHSDGYPTGLGHTLWHRLHTVYGGRTVAFLDHAISRHRAGWSSYPHTCYCHGFDESRPDDWMIEDSRTVDPLFIEWVYVFGPSWLTVLAGVECAADDPAITPEQRAEIETHHPWRVREGVWYKHTTVAGFPLDGPEPDWGQIEQNANDLYQSAKEIPIQYDQVAQTP